VADQLTELGYDSNLERSRFKDTQYAADGSTSEPQNSAQLTSSIPAGGVAYAQTALSHLVSGEDIQSEDFVTGSAGWRIQGNGDVEFNDGVFRGSITASTIDIGGSDATSFHVDIDGNMWLGAATFATAPFSVSNAGALIATGVTVTGSITATSGAIGGFDIGADYIRDVANSMGMASTVTAGDDVRFWAGDTYANRATAPFRVTEAGAVTGSSVTITGGSVSTSTLSGLIQQTNLNVADRGWSQTCVFSVTDADTVAWGDGILTSADGTAYSITGADTGDMTAKTYIYLDTAVSTTLYQTTTTATTAVGVGKVLVAVAQNGTDEATFEVLQAQGGKNINASEIAAGSITANEIAASTITSAKMSVTSLSSIAADLGTITAGTITLTGAGYVRGGQTDYATGTGFFLGYSGDYKFSIGSTTNYMRWDGTYLTLKGSFDVGANGVINNSSYLVANLPIPPTTVGFNSPSGSEY